MKSKLQYVFKIVVFVSLFYLIFSFASAVLHPKWETRQDTTTRFATFYSEPRNSIDVLFIGPSTFREGISPLLIWQDYGFTSYVRSTGGQSSLVSYYYLLEALKYQHPKVVVIDAGYLYMPFDFDDNEGYLRISVDPMRMSVEKVKLISGIVSNSEMQTYSSWLFPLLRYHSRWKELKPEDFKFYERDMVDHFKGSYIDYRTLPKTLPANFMKPSTDIKEYDALSRYYYEKIVLLCKENDIEVLFVTLPKLYWKYSYYNGIKQLADQYNSPYIDYNLPDYFAASGVDTTTDFVDDRHLNVFGQEKISKNIGALLQETYNLPDNRNNPEYEQWNVDLQYLKDQIEK
jgi:hypothetical protein